MPKDPEPLKEILYRTTARYVTIRPDGLDLDERFERSVQARILDHGGARTLYKNRKPDCRSLNGVRSIKGRDCGDCPSSPRCTPQVRLDFLVDRRPYRLLLAYTSAKNFLLYAGKLKGEGKDVTEVVTRINVIDRGSWGELRFAQEGSQ
ncbi:MAG: hypothetical protein ACE5IM_11235 [Nitrospinota bacterium]